MNGIAIIGFAVRVFGAVAVRPHLWLVSSLVFLRLIPDRWWATAPFLPMPRREYIRFRTVTQYGDMNQSIKVLDVLAYLEWVKGLR